MDLVPEYLSPVVRGHELSNLESAKGTPVVKKNPGIMGVWGGQGEGFLIWPLGISGLRMCSAGDNCIR